MKIRLDKNGELYIIRNVWSDNVNLAIPDKKEKAGMCPFKARDVCGDWCSLFGEPRSFLKGRNRIKKIALPLCKKSIVVNEEDFLDERK
jgi:hypothetical protein